MSIKMFSLAAVFMLAGTATAFSDPQDQKDKDKAQAIQQLTIMGNYFRDQDQKDRDQLAQDKAIIFQLQQQLDELRKQSGQKDQDHGNR